MLYGRDANWLFESENINEYFDLVVEYTQIHHDISNH